MLCQKSSRYQKLGRILEIKRKSVHTAWLRGLQAIKNQSKKNLYRREESCILPTVFLYSLNRSFPTSVTMYIYIFQLNRDPSLKKKRFPYLYILLLNFSTNWTRNRPKKEQETSEWNKTSLVVEAAAAFKNASRSIQKNLKNPWALLCYFFGSL